MIAVIARYATGDAPTAARQALLPAHLAHVEASLDQILVAGPLLDAEGAMVGSLLVLNVADAAAAQAFMARDPYHDGGIWDQIDYRSYKAVAGSWVGGKNW